MQIRMSERFRREIQEAIENDDQLTEAGVDTYLAILDANKDDEPIDDELIYYVKTVL